MPSGTTLAERLAEHFGSPSYGGCGPENLAAARTLLLDHIGVALGGSATASGRLAADLAIQDGGRPEAVVIGRQAKVPAAAAAFANAIASHSLELDDVDVEALFHFGPPVVSAALACAHVVGASGRDLMSAIIAGSEMMERLSRATNPSLRDRGFHTTAVTGVFGATVASARLLKLDVGQFVSALGLAGAQSAGLMEMYGSSMQKRFNPGPAARNGLMAARLAQLGFTGAETIFEGERGFLRSFANKVDSDALDPGKGPAYALKVELKPYACARPIHPAIDAALSLRPGLLNRLHEIQSITVYRHPMWVKYHGNTEPKTYHEAQVSLPYSVAVALVEGDAFLGQYLRLKEMPAEVHRLTKSVSMVPDPGLPSTVGCRVEIGLAGGERSVCQVDYPKGSVQRPLTAAEQVDKFLKLSVPVIGDKQAAAIVSAVGQVEEISDMRSLAALLQVGEGSGVGSHS